MDIVQIKTCSPFVTKDGSVIRELLSHRNSVIANQSLAEATIGPGIKTESHYHKSSEEIYYILSGSALMYLGSEARRVQAGDAVAIPPGIVHWLHNDGAIDLIMLCCCAPGYEHEDTFIEN